MNSMYPRLDGSLVLREMFRYGNEVAHRATFGDDVPSMVADHTEIEPAPIRGNLTRALAVLTIDGPPVEFGWSTYTLERND